MSLYSELKDSYTKNKKEIDKVLTNKSTTTVLGKAAVKILKVLVEKTKEKLKNKPKDLRSFKAYIYFPVKLGKELTGLSQKKQKEGLDRLMYYKLIRLVYKRDIFKYSVRLIYMNFDRFEAFNEYAINLIKTFNKYGGDIEEPYLMTEEEEEDEFPDYIKYGKA